MSAIMFLNANSLYIPLADGSVQMVVTSPPYWNLRDYNVDGQIGLEETPQEFVDKLVQVFREVRRVLRDDGTCWINLGDSYANDTKWGGESGGKNYTSSAGGYGGQRIKRNTGLKPKDLCMIPARVALALQADGWYLRSDIIWCLSGGTWVYAKTQKGEMPMTVKDMARLDPATVKLWNGERWTQVLGWSKSQRKGDEMEIVLRSGERISCTPTHKFPTERGLLEAKDIKVGDCLRRVRLPEPQEPKDCNIDEQAAWLAGLYIAEGSRSGDCIQIAGHAKEEERWRRVQMIAARYGGSATRTIDGNMMNIRVYGKIVNAIIDYLVTGKTAKDKGFAPVVWQYSNSFISEMLDGYLKGDGHWDDANQRWRLGFTRNYNLERDLRTACARLGYKITLNMSTTPYNGKQVATFRGEIRYEASTYHNHRNDAEVMEIRKSRCREVYDIGVEDEPHVFALASGLLTHNSKPNPMPESVTDRPTKAHEYLFLLSKSPRYFYDAAAIYEPVSQNTHARISQDVANQVGSFRANGGGKTNGPMKAVVRTPKQVEAGSGIKNNDSFNNALCLPVNERNKRTVWHIATEGYSGAHYATFPQKLVEPCIKAGTSEAGCCSAKVKKLKVKNDLTPDQKERVERWLKRKGLL
jgi:DNA modification methylase